MDQNSNDFFSEFFLKLPNGTRAFLPPVLRILLGVALNKSIRQRICILLPDTRGVAEFCAIFASLRQLECDFDSQKRAFLERRFHKGDFVRSTADGGVYQVGGMTHNGVKLNFLNKSNMETSGCRIILGDRMLGFESTSRRRPMAKSSKALVLPAATKLDRLAKVGTLGNTNVIQNRVLLLGSMAEFERFLDSVSLGRIGAFEEDGVSLGDLFCWGALTDAGLSLEHPSGGGGDPLVAVARDPAQLRHYFGDGARTPHSATIFSSLVTTVLGRLDDIERVSQTQQVMLFADARRRPEVARLKESGWIVWELQPWELLPPADDARRLTGLAGIDSSRRAAACELARNVPQFVASNTAMEAVYDCFTALGDALRDPELESDLDVVDIRERCRDTFFTVVGWLAFPLQDELDSVRAELSRIGQDAPRLTMVAGHEAVAAAAEFVDSICRFLEFAVPSTATPKGKKLLECAEAARRSPSLRQVVVTGHRRSTEMVRRFLDRHDLALECPTLVELRERDAPFRVIAVNVLWPEQFGRLVDPWPAASLAFAGYKFEIEIYERWLAVRERARQGLAADDALRVTATGMAAADLPQKPRSYVAPTFIRVIGEGAETFERISRTRERDWSKRPNVHVNAEDELVSGRFCRFVGHSWTVFSEEHHVTKLVGSESGSRTSVSSVEVSDLRIGDRIVMRDPGQKDAIRLLAEADIGTGKYQALLETAKLWQNTLVEAGRSPEQVSERLSALGVRRNIATIRSWILNQEMIGPRLKDDVLAIYEAFAPNSDAANWEACWSAISQLRSLHVRAGGRLSDLIIEQCGGLLLEPAEEEAQITLDMGTAWILEVAHIDEALSQWPQTAVNRLHWDDRLTHMGEITLEDLGL